MIGWIWGAVAFAGSSAAERDAQPLGRYLTLEEIHDGLVAALPTFAECYTHSGARGRVEVGEVFVDFTIGPDGAVTEAAIRDSRSGVPDLDACLRERMLTVTFRPHDEEPVHVGYPFVFREGALLPYPMVFVKERDVGLMFFYLPGSSEDVDAWVRALAASKPVSAE